jgi:hypothetical protein
MELIGAVVALVIFVTLIALFGNKVDDTSVYVAKEQEQYRWLQERFLKAGFSDEFMKEYAWMITPADTFEDVVSRINRFNPMVAEGLVALNSGEITMEQFNNSFSRP